MVRLEDGDDDGDDDDDDDGPDPHCVSRLNQSQPLSSPVERHLTNNGYTACKALIAMREERVLITTFPVGEIIIETSPLWV